MPCDIDYKRTKHVYDSGRLVVNETYRFPIHYPEMAVLLILLKDMDVGTLDPVHGYASLPLSTLAHGEYQIPLAKPYKMGARVEYLRMWVKVKLEWEDGPVAAAEVEGKDVGLAKTLQQQVGQGEVARGMPAALKKDVAAPMGVVTA